jgi:hypothetical protein
MKHKNPEPLPKIPHETQVASSESAEAKERKFTLFPKLPIELRFEIWREALPGQRIVELVYEDKAIFFSDDDYPDLVKLSGNVGEIECVVASLEGETTDPEPKYWTNISPPVLGVSREARTEAQKKYTTSFDGSQFGRCIPFDPSADTLFFPLSPSHRDFVSKTCSGPEVFHQIQFLAVDADIYWRFFNHRCDFTNLRSLTFAMHEKGCQDQFEVKPREVGFRNIEARDVLATLAPEYDFPYGWMKLFRNTKSEIQLGKHQPLISNQ